MIKTAELDGLIACPSCDLLHRIEGVAVGQTAKCKRCHSTLIAPKSETIDRTVALAISTIILMVGALIFPFLGMSKSGLEHEASILGVIAALSQGWYRLMALFVLLFVVALPVLRTALLLYTLAPLRAGRPPLPHAKRAFAWAEALLPWAMTEIFILGTMVALIKIGGLAKVSFGVSFWVFCLLVAVIAFKNASVCRWSIWQTVGKIST